MSVIDRTSTFCKFVDTLDAQIAALVKRRNALLSKPPRSYDSDGEGEIYFQELEMPQAELVFHAVARLDE